MDHRPGRCSIEVRSRIPQGYEEILDETAEGRHTPEAAEDHADGMEGKVRNEQPLGGHRGEEPVDFS